MQKKHFDIKVPDDVELTEEYYDKISAEKEQLEKTREEILVRLQAAREMGDLSENGAYKYAKFELRDTDRKLRRIGYLLRWGKVVKNSGKAEVGFGSKVSVDNGLRKVTFTLVSKHESDPEENKIAVTSPLGQALMGKKQGEVAVVDAPMGKMEYKIEKVE